MHICLLEPYDAGSHAAWAHGYAAHSRHRVTVLSLQGRFWQWRMHGGAVTLARRFRDIDPAPDLVLATDMLDLATWLALTRESSARLPVALYMHENQLTYPPAPGRQLDLHYAYVNYTSMLCARRVLFNSQYHLDAWFDALPGLLRAFPDHRELGTVAALRGRSQVLPLGLDLAGLDGAPGEAAREGPALIIWNHRWEHDKDPETFLRVVERLAARGLDFRLALLGETFAQVPPGFDAARQRLGGRVAHYGYLPRRADYAAWLRRGDIVASTARHDFFGAAVAEAVYCGCLPILPNRLAYPQFVPAAYHDLCLYADEAGLEARLAYAIEHVGEMRAISLRGQVAGYDWAHMAPETDRTMEEAAAG